LADYSANSITKPNPSFRDLFSFLYDLTTLDLDLFVLLVRAANPKTLEDLAKDVARDKSTVFRSLQRLSAIGLCTRDTRNLREGGYYHVYKCSDIDSIRRATKNRVGEVQEGLTRNLKRFEEEMDAITRSKCMTILIADDERDIATSYKMALGQRGHNVVLTRNGEECLEVYKAALKEKKGVSPGNSAAYTANPFDVVILDYKMPKINGMDVAKEMLELVPEQRIIFASAFVKDTLLESIKKLGQVVELMQKPFDAKALIDTVEDREIQESLKRLASNINQVDTDDPESEPIKELFGAVRLIQKARTF
jgi:predicted transcriptional regulator/FixJ family two-component response regulator